MVTYKEELIRAMEWLGQKSNTVFIGYNVKCGPRMNGTLPTLPPSRSIETPVAENLIMGLAMGISLKGYRPIVCFERMDFTLACADAIFNHLDKLPKLSGNQFTFPVIIRVCVGCNEPIDPGLQHMCDYTKMFQENLEFPVITLDSPNMIVPWYKLAYGSNSPIMLVEHKRLYKETR